jgi:TPR repeat protein
MRKAIFLALLFIYGGVPTQTRYAVTSPVETKVYAEKGHAAAQHNLGIMYLDGDGVHKNPVSAYAWFNLAAAPGDESANESKNLIAKNMTPDA